MKKVFAILAAGLLAAFAANAQENVFYPGLTAGIQGGVNYTTSNYWGIPYLSHLNIPNIQLSLGYDFTPVFGLRGTLSGPFANYPAADGQTVKQFAYAQLGLDAMFDICNIFGYNSGRIFNPYLFLGGAGFYRFAGNNAASGLGLGVRAGAGADIRINDLISVSLELVDNALGNSFNTRDDNAVALGGILDIPKPIKWDGNLAALVGLKFNIGANAKRKAAIAAAEAAAIEEAARLAAAEQARKEAEAKAAAEAAAKAEAERLAAEKAEAERIAAEKAEAERIAAELAAARSMQENVLFLKNKTNIRKNQEEKIARIVALMNEYPEAVVTLSGYADKETGNPSLNMTLSEGRAKNVAKALEAAGIAADRIFVEYYGDTQRVSDIQEENRVTVMVTK